MNRGRQGIRLLNHALHSGAHFFLICIKPFQQLLSAVTLGNEIGPNPLGKLSTVLGM